MARIMFLTGRPGVGKTSVLLRTIDVLKSSGYKVGGMVSREIKIGEVRVGFEIINLLTDNKGWLAHINQKTGPRVGKYRVNLNDLKNIGVTSILNAVEEADIIVVDEIGPMELYSTDFKDALIKGLKCNKPVIGTIHYRIRDRLFDLLLVEENVEILEVTSKNREKLHITIVNNVVQYLQTTE